MSSPGQVQIDRYRYPEGCYKTGKYRYDVADLVRQAEGLKVFDLPLNGLNIGIWPWADPSIGSFCYHMKRVKNVNLKYPIILNNLGYICEGWHRVVAAILHGDETIKAVRLVIMPDCIED